MYPSWDTVEYASTRLMSHCFRAIVAANSAVRAPTPATTALDTGAMANSRLVRATRYRITSYNVCYTKLLRRPSPDQTGEGRERGDDGKGA